MTMQTSGQISIGQAMAECGIGGEQDAGAVSLSRLAGVSPGQQYAWSYWYGKTNLPDITNEIVAQASMNVDRLNQLYINLSNGTFTVGSIVGDHGPHLESATVDAVPFINLYSSWTLSLQWLSGSHRMNVVISQQPSPANGFVALIEWDDDGRYAAIAHNPGNLPGDGENMNGSTSEGVSVLLTCTK